MAEFHAVEPSTSSSPINELKLKELDIRFSDDGYDVAKKIGRYRNLSKICLKGSDFEYGIDEVVEAIQGTAFLPAFWWYCF